MICKTSCIVCLIGRTVGRNICLFFLLDYSIFQPSSLRRFCREAQDVLSNCTPGKTTSCWQQLFKPELRPTTFTRIRCTDMPNEHNAFTSPWDKVHKDELKGCGILIGIGLEPHCRHGLEQPRLHPDVTPRWHEEPETRIMILPKKFISNQNLVLL